MVLRAKTAIRSIAGKIGCTAPRRNRNRQAPPHQAPLGREAGPARPTSPAYNASS